MVNAASFLPGISPGCLATIFGPNLATVDGVVSANSNPLFTELSGVEVLVNGIAAPLFSVVSTSGQDQINVQVPFETDIGPDAADIEILNFGETVAIVTSDSFTEDPGIFVSDGYAVAVRGFDGSLIRPDNPASPGETIVLYTTDLAL